MNADLSTILVLTASAIIMVMWLLLKEIMLDEENAAIEKQKENNQKDE
jgi:hypothetical protein